MIERKEKQKCEANLIEGSDLNIDKVCEKDRGKETRRGYEPFKMRTGRPDRQTSERQRARHSNNYMDR